MAAAKSQGTSERQSESDIDILGDKGYAERLVRWRSAQLRRRPDFQNIDRGDLEQELWLDLLRRLPRFNPGRASIRTFIRRVVDHRVSTILRAKRGDRRGPRMESLNDLGRDEDGRPVELWQTLSQDSHIRRAGSSDPEAPHLQDLRIDLKAGLQGLPADLKDLAQWLTHYTPAEASRASGIPRSTLYKRMKKVRAHMEKGGLAKYLPGAGSDPRACG